MEAVPWLNDVQATGRRGSRVKARRGLCAISRPVQKRALNVSETADFTHGCLCHRCRRWKALCTTSRDEEPTA